MRKKYISKLLILLLVLVIPITMIACRRKYKQTVLSNNVGNDFKWNENNKTVIITKPSDTFENKNVNNGDISPQPKVTDKVTKPQHTEISLPNKDDNITSKFTDLNFRNSVYDLIKKNYPQPIYYSDVCNITDLNIRHCLLHDLNGIEYFKSLTELDCSDNNLNSLDVSKNTALTKLDCSWNSLSSLDVSKNTALTDLDCSVNYLDSLDLQKNSALCVLNCFGNNLTLLNVSKNSSLNTLICHYNKLTSLDVSEDTKLAVLNCSYNYLTTLDLSNNFNIYKLNCIYNQITTLYSIEDIWLNDWYQSQYTDISHVDTVKNLVITRKK